MGFEGYNPPNVIKKNPKGKELSQIEKFLNKIKNQDKDRACNLEYKDI